MQDDGEKYLFISLKMAGRCAAEIEAEMQDCLQKARDMTGIDYKLIDSLCPYESSSPLYALGYALCALSFADAAYFAPGYESARGCKIERAACEAYGVPILGG